MSALRMTSGLSPVTSLGARAARRSDDVGTSVSEVGYDPDDDVNSALDITGSAVKPTYAAA